MAAQVPAEVWGGPLTIRRAVMQGAAGRMISPEALVLCYVRQYKFRRRLSRGVGR